MHYATLQTPMLQTLLLPTHMLIMQMISTTEKVTAAAFFYSIMALFCGLVVNNHAQRHLYGARIRCCISH